MVKFGLAQHRDVGMHAGVRRILSLILVLSCYMSVTHAEMMQFTPDRDNTLYARLNARRQVATLPGVSLRLLDQSSLTGTKSGLASAAGALVGPSTGCDRVC